MEKKNALPLSLSPSHLHTTHTFQYMDHVSFCRRGLTVMVTPPSAAGGGGGCGGASAAPATRSPAAAAVAGAPAASTRVWVPRGAPACVGGER